MSEILSRSAAWEIIAAQADSGNDECIDCQHSERTGAGWGHTCIADEPQDCPVLEELLDRFNVDLGPETTVESGHKS